MVVSSTIPGKMKVSIIKVIFNRYEYHKAEFDSLIHQSMPKDDFELVIVDESTDPEVPLLIWSYTDKLNIKYIHASGWKSSDKVHCQESGKIAHSMYHNWNIKQAEGEIILIEAGEFMHIGDSLYELYLPHQSQRCVVQGIIRDIKYDAAIGFGYDKPTSTLREDHIWGQWFGHPEHTPLYDEMAFSSAKRTDLLRLNGCDEAFMLGTQCEVGEVFRRLRRSGCEVVWTKDIVGGHIEHERRDQDVNSENYRAAMYNRRLLDQGYYGGSPKVKYYRPGTEPRPLVANEGKEIGIFPEEVHIWSLAETLRYLR
jgi:glycosyltransferase involved in cell wall biosynthesis